MEIIEQLAMIGIVIPVSLLWFWLVMKLAKHTVGKDPEAWKMFLFLLISGPVGWIVLVIAFVNNLIDKI
jgi:fumarate reductase subunit C